MFSLPSKSVVAGAAVGATVAVVAAPLVLGAAGFTAGGVAAGSLAAGAQAGIGHLYIFLFSDNRNNFI